VSAVLASKSVAIATLAGVSRKLKEGRVMLFLDSGTAVGSLDPPVARMDGPSKAATVELEIRKASLFVDGILLYDATLTPYDDRGETVDAEALFVFPDAVKAVAIGVQESETGGEARGAPRRPGYMEVVTAANRP